MPREVYEGNPFQVLQSYLDGGVQPGSVGVIAAKAGVGKSALLVHVALDALLRDQGVLHVSLKDTVDHVRAYYDEVFGAAARVGRVRDRAGAMVAAERHRMIHSYRDRDFTVATLRNNLRMLQEVAQFEPALVVVDGFEAAGAAASLDALRELAREQKVVVWLAVRANADGQLPESLVNGASVVLKLSPDGPSVKITLTQGGQSQTAPFSLDPATMLVVGDEGWDAPSAVLAPRPTDCTLYSGGANGSEESFGIAAEKWGVHEVNFTFEGHKQARSRGRYELSPRELAAGDVSLVYVSRRLNRTYSEGSLIRKVLQTLWHMVSRSQQVFVVGQIQEDGTVVGGTGWSVELARMWNKSLWVYDQDRKGWYRWDGNDWVPGTPVIESIHFTATGTRYLTEDGQRAIDELFERSFAPRVAE